MTVVTLSPYPFVHSLYIGFPFVVLFPLWIFLVRQVHLVDEDPNARIG